MREKKVRYETYSYKLTALSPVHIGSGEELLPLQYYIDKQQNRIIVPELEKIASDPQLARIFINNLSTNYKFDKTLNELLPNPCHLLNPDNWQYATCSPSGAGPYLYTFDRLEKEIKSNNNSNIRLANKTSDYKVYIPGSSIKGALKTAWLYYQCSNDEKAFKQIVSDPKDSDLNNTFLKSFSNRLKRPCDLFQVLQIGDSQSEIANKILGIVAERILNATDSAWIGEKDKKRKDAVDEFKNSWTFYEAIRRGVELIGKINFDIGLLTESKAIKKINWNENQRQFSLVNLCKAANEFAKKICIYEENYFNRVRERQSKCDVEEVIKFYKKQYLDINTAPANTVYLSIGHGSGWHKLTIGLLLKEHLEQKDFQTLRQQLHLADRHIDFEFPKTRKLPMSGETKSARPFGWVKITFDKINREN